MTIIQLHITQGCVARVFHVQSKSWFRKVIPIGMTVRFPEQREAEDEYDKPMLHIGNIDGIEPIYADFGYDHVCAETGMAILMCDHVSAECDAECFKNFMTSKGWEVSE